MDKKKIWEEFHRSLTDKPDSYICSRMWELKQHLEEQQSRRAPELVIDDLQELVTAYEYVAKKRMVKCEI